MSPIDASSLDVTVTEGEQWRRTLSVTVPADLVKAEQTSITKKLAGRMNLKGFRAGKVPKSVIQRRFGPAVEREALDHVIQEAYRSALETNDLRPISEGEIEDVNFTPDAPLTFKVSFDVRPEFTLNRLSGFKAERPSSAVAAEQVDAVLARIQDQQATWAPQESGQAEEGAMVSVTVTRLDTEEGEEADEGRKYEFVLGSGQAIPDIEAGIKTLDVGAEGTFDIAFPEDFPDEERRGEAQKVQITLESVQTKVLPELDDAFAKTVGDFDNLDALRAKIEEDLAKDSERQADSAVRTQLLQQVIDANPFEVPASMIDAYLNSIIGNPEGVDPEKLAEVKEQLRGEGEVSVKRMLTIDRIAELQDLRASEDEVDDKIETIAEAAGESPSKVYANLQKSGRIASLEQEITEDKVFEFLKSGSEITEAP